MEPAGSLVFGRAGALLAPFRVRFTAGRCRYELVGRPDPRAPTPGAPGAGAAGAGSQPDGTTTEGGARVELTAEERALLVRLAAPVLRDPACGPESLPANQAVAHELGWSLPKFNDGPGDRLESIAVRLKATGGVRVADEVAGQAGGVGRLVIGRADLERLGPAGATAVEALDDFDGLPGAAPSVGALDRVLRQTQAEVDADLTGTTRSGGGGRVASPM